jgi:transposase
MPPPSIDEIRERAARIAEKTGMDEGEAREMLAIATGLSRGCLEEFDEDGRPLPPKPRRLAPRERP